MAVDFNEKDIETLSKIHHEIYRKMLHSSYDEQFTKINGLTSLEISVLSILSQTPGAMLREMADQLTISKSTLTSVVDRLEHRGYVYRVISSRDRRSFELVLTEDGKAAQQEHIDYEHGLYRKIVGALDTQAEVDTFLILLDKVADRF